MLSDSMRSGSPRLGGQSGQQTHRDPRCTARSLFAVRPAHLWALGLLWGCTSKEGLPSDSASHSGSADTAAPPIDADADGYALPTDCDDNNATIHPDAVETCNEVDDNCDGVTDEGVASTYYADADADGYGSMSDTVSACEMPAGYLSDNSDCDDNNPAAYPGANETCSDAVDLNCDGAVTYVDADGDGSAACLDCDDGDPSSFPGATDVAGDGIDQDCDGVICQPGPIGAIAIWRGDGDLVDEVGGRNGTSVGSVSYTTGMVGDAIDFAPGSSVSASEAALPIGGADRTIALWMRMESAPTNESIFVAYGNLGGFGESYVLGSTVQSPFFSQWGSAVFGLDFSLREWHLLAVTTVGDAITLYMDGAVAATGELPINTVVGTGIHMGTFPGDLAEGRAFDGQLDEVMIWDRALEEGEIADLYAIGADGTCP